MAFKKYAEFTGRSRRKEYWMFTLFNVIVLFSLIIISVSIGLEDYAMLPFGVYLLVIFIPSLALAIRRLHDQGKSGWYILVRCIPFIGGIWYLVLMCTEGDYNANSYGLNPKQPVDNEINDIGASKV